ncbi:Cof-type HAD-IIB family hydrolase [Martelella alba]|uniref:Cof-type HAD-IIB family hydrolase n=1 Tax=Martelella alba TaxID=2590451 RepID=A0ABY2SQN8_9HYPH|nr:Cof-type HAD-IIB family hydrolase [Martelella alba]TKI08517.1 Cof-type HAD-IIB family hydrolase [Martelella alba]
MSYRVLALDLDGTLLTSDQHIHPAVRDALRRIALTARVILVTGRHHTAARPYHRELGLTTPVISCNGAYLYDYATESVLAGQAIDHEDAAQFLALARQAGLKVAMYTDERMMMSASTPVAYLSAMARWSLQLPAESRPDIVRVASLESALADTRYVWKFVVEGDIGPIGGFARQQWLQSHFTLEQSWHNRIDFARRGNTKGARLQALLDDCAIAPEQVIAIGDNHNDLSMLQVAGLGVAMANGDSAIKAIADRITQESNDGQGILDVLQDYFIV